MSTFDGIVAEFPDIRIDYFRHHNGKSPPKACFLSHIHSDHLQGLESLRMPFVYCSHVTRSLLLKMEKYPHRINFSKGILEARKQTYSNLKKLLRPMPLETPVQLELSPKTTIRVTLFDANHCPGAVMFLIEGDGKAVLYTGDIRAEEWWVNALTRSPVILPYATGLKFLDCIYLDTTFASHQDIHREFPSKAAGLTELITKVRRCRADSKFYFRAWTLGYEDVWLTLSHELEAKVHVDQYQHRLFRAAAENDTSASSALTGFKVGNSEHSGCLTTETDAQIHSCEPGMACHAALKADKNVIWITPIISRLRDGTELAEMGAGGGKGDLYQRHEVELGNLNPFILESLRKLCDSVVQDSVTAVKLRDMLAVAHEKDEKIPLDGVSGRDGTDMSIKEFLRLVTQRDNEDLATHQSDRIIHFAYSRHSSHSELRHLVKELNPRDVYPCTVDLDRWEELNLSMESLFGDLCSGDDFEYDRNIREELARRKAANGESERADTEFDTQRTESINEESQEYIDVSQDKSFTELADQTTGTRQTTAAEKWQRLDEAAMNMSASLIPVSGVNEGNVIPKQTFASSQTTSNGGDETEVEEQDHVDTNSSTTVEVADGADRMADETTSLPVPRAQSLETLSSPQAADSICQNREHVDSQAVTRKRKRQTPGENLRDAWYKANGGSDIYVPAEDRTVHSQAEASEGDQD